MNELLERVTRLEELSAYREQLVDELNQVVITQANTIDRLSTDLKRLQEQVKAVMPSLTLAPEEDSPPPHY
ncbi:MAG: SlyX family protein [Planctomycetota bacterium]|jgi:SlyX protein